jgi:hypothetical protein
VDEVISIAIVQPCLPLTFSHAYETARPQETLDAVLSAVPGDLEESVEVAPGGRWAGLTLSINKIERYDYVDSILRVHCSIGSIDSSSTLDPDAAFVATAPEASNESA